ncbi:MAG TPA: hypothetical protein VN648_03570 [Candidatus Methylomirabilis sp.]|nr:hypothetical protein [Candidatus Methylomirabilis sp.]
MRPSVQACKEVRLPERTGQAVVVDGVHGKMRHSIVWSKRAHRDTGNHEGLAPGPQFIEPHRPDRSTSRNTRRVQESCLQVDTEGCTCRKKILSAPQVIPITEAMKNLSEPPSVCFSHQQVYIGHRSRNFRRVDKGSQGQALKDHDRNPCLRCGGQYCRACLLQAYCSGRGDAGGMIQGLHDGVRDSRAEGCGSMNRKVKEEGKLKSVGLCKDFPPWHRPF